MKAAFIERHGGPEVLQYGDMPDPVAAPGQVVVDIAAASVNGAESPGCNAIQPSLLEIDPAPDQVTSPAASNSSSNAGE